MWWFSIGTITCDIQHIMNPSIFRSHIGPFPTAHILERLMWVEYPVIKTTFGTNKKRWNTMTFQMVIHPSTTLVQVHFRVLMGSRTYVLEWSHPSFYTSESIYFSLSCWFIPYRTLFRVLTWTEYPVVFLHYRPDQIRTKVVKLSCCSYANEMNEKMK
jgi:hypothetical protein